MEKEIWKPISGYEGLYEISNFGRVKNRHGKILKLPLTHKGYRRIELWRKSKMKHFYVHRLVANAFIPNPCELPYINHKDENKENNNVENLEWCTAAQNLSYGSHNTNVATALKNHPSTSRIVECYTKGGVLLKVYPSMGEAEREKGIQTTLISQCCKGKLKTAGGFIWKYARQTI